MLWLVQQQLRSQSPRVRREAVQRLRRATGDSVFAALRRVLQDDPDPLVRVEAVEVIAEIRDPRLLDTLAEALTDSSADVRTVVVECLRRMGDLGAIPALVPLLQTPDPAFRSRVAQTLKLLGWEPSDPQTAAIYLVALGEIDRAAYMGPSAVAALAELLGDPAHQRRVLVVNRLAEIGGAAAGQVVMMVLADEDPRVRAAAVNALRRMKEHRAVAELATLLTDAEAGVRVAAAGALGVLGGAPSVPLLVPLLEDRHWEVRAAALEALGRLREAAAIDSVVVCLVDDDHEVRSRATEALGALGDPRAIPFLVMTFFDPGSPVRLAASRALQRIDPFWERSPGARSVLPFIQTAARDADESVRWAATEALRRMGVAEESVEVGFFASAGRKTTDQVLSDMLRDADPALRQAAAEALVRLAPDAQDARWQRLAEDPDPWVRAALAGSAHRATGGSEDAALPGT